jgi:hypothetical protein
VTKAVLDAKSVVTLRSDTAEVVARHATLEPQAA